MYLLKKNIIFQRNQSQFFANKLINKQNLICLFKKKLKFKQKFTDNNK